MEENKNIDPLEALLSKHKAAMGEADVPTTPPTVTNSTPQIPDDVDIYGENDQQKEIEAEDAAREAVPSPRNSVCRREIHTALISVELHERHQADHLEGDENQPESVFQIKFNQIAHRSVDLWINVLWVCSNYSFCFPLSGIPQFQKPASENL